MTQDGTIPCFHWIGFFSAWPSYLLLVQLEGGLDEIPQGGELLLLLVLSLLDLSRT